MSRDDLDPPSIRASIRGKRIVVAKPGLDGHDAGAKIIALTLRDAGADVVYTGLRRTPEYIARVAIDEDADALGLSILSGSHCELVAATLAQLRAMGGEDIKVFVGGVIPPHDRDHLLSLGVTAIYTAEMRLDDVVTSLAGHLS